MKTTSNGRRPQNIKSGISQQPLIGSYSNFKLSLRLQWRRQPMKEDLKILKVEYISNHVLDHSQILNLNLDDHFYQICKWRRPSMEDDLKKLKVKYLSNQLLDHTQILYVILDDQTIFFFNEDNFQLKTTSKY